MTANDKQTPGAFEFGMVRFNKDPNTVAEKAKSAAARATSATPEDMLFGGSDATVELETPIAGDAEQLKSVSEGWETASQWSQGAEDVIVGAMGDGDVPAAKPAAKPEPAKTSSARTPTVAAGRPASGVIKVPAAGSQAAIVKPARKARKRPTASSYWLAGLVGATGLGCGAWLALGIAAWPLAIVTATLGLIGAGIAFVLTSR